MDYLAACSLAFPFLLAPAVYFLGKHSTKRLNVLTIAACALELLFSVLFFLRALSGDTQTVTFSHICGLGLSFRMDGFRALYFLVTSFAWLASSVFAADYMRRGENRARYAFFQLLTLSGTVGVFLSADLRRPVLPPAAILCLAAAALILAAYLAANRKLKGADGR